MSKVKKMLALTVDGQITYCSAPPERRGMGRCNHIAHQDEGETPIDFMQKVDAMIKTEGYTSDKALTLLEQLDETLLDERSTSKRLGLRTDLDDDIQDQRELTVKLIEKYGNVKNPEWEEVLKDPGITGIFNIGSPGDEMYREAELVSVEKVEKNSHEGDSYELKAKFMFEGEEYELSYGEVPKVNPDGTIIVNSTPFRVLPVMEQYKAGLRAFGSSVSVQQKDGNLGFNLKYSTEFINEKGEKDWKVNMYGQEVSLSYARDYIFDKNDGSELKPGPRYGLKNLDEAFFQRFPDFEHDYSVITGLPKEEPNDLEWRRVVRYEDMVKQQYLKQSRRMATTFRSNLVKRDRAKEKNPNITKEELDELYPLFYQQNLTDNIKKDLSTRSNVQYAESLNAFAALSQSMKISLTGRDGWNKDKAPRSLRLPHPSHKGLTDALDVSSGGNVGLTLTLSGGYIDENGFIKKKPEGEHTTSLKDFVPFRLNNNTDRGSLSEAHLKQSVPILGGEDPVCDTPAWKDMKGAKLGCNLRVAYIPFEGVYEDAVTISESTAAKMKTIEKREVFLEPHQISKFTEGQKLRRKDNVGGNEIKADSVVKKVTDHSVIIETPYEMGIGDKLSGFHGNKGTVAKIIPDDQMPKIVNEKGLAEPAQLIMSPMGVGGRRNIGQVLEANANMDGEASVNKTREVLLPSGHKVNSTAGVSYIHRLNHIAQKSLSSNLDKLGTDGDFKSARLGNMENILLSGNEDRLKVLDYLRNQEQSDTHRKLDELLKAVGVEFEGKGLNL